MSSIFCCFTSSSLILSESLSECQNNKLEKYSSPCKNKHFQCLLVLPAPRRWDLWAHCLWILQRLIVFSAGRRSLFTCRTRWEPVLSEPPEVSPSDSLLMQSSHAGAVREANPGRTRWNINALRRTTSPFLAQKLLCHFWKSHFHCIRNIIKGLARIFDHNFVAFFMRRWVEASGFVPPGFRPDLQQRYLSRVDEDEDVRWQLMDSYVEIAGLISRDRSSAYNYRPVCVSEMCRPGLWPPIWEAPQTGASFFFTSPRRLPHTLIPARPERGRSLNQQPGIKCEERRAGCIIDSGLKWRIQVGRCIWLVVSRSVQICLSSFHTK